MNIVQTRPSIIISRQAAIGRSQHLVQHFSNITCEVTSGARRAATGKVFMQTAMGSEQKTSEQWAEYNKIWSNIWQTEQVPRFDKGSSSPQLLQLLRDGTLQIKGKRAFVPGCGRGYDVLEFALAGASLSVGLDICPIAVAAAEAELVKMLSPDHPAVVASQLVVGDFFTYEHPDKLNFDVGYDYTFLCALHPDMRAAWAHAWSRLLSPGGELITMIYPVDPSMDAASGPPWPVTPDLYKQLLPPAGFELVSLSQVPEHLSHPARVGREWMGHWRLTG